ncbi:hypothetical protein Baya_8641 [Bagarius yarrelli]|uniref:Uncharacterized protein n=1 Tax=Bagarius yarrelli TaxID=175774 RepID=A0A556U4J4_BAGYA|nr:hypothetical protein Baya_8641 [Bagarius yarrelli]
MLREHPRVGYLLSKTVTGPVRDILRRGQKDSATDRWIGSQGHRLRLHGVKVLRTSGDHHSESRSVLSVYLKDPVARDVFSVTGMSPIPLQAYRRKIPKRAFIPNWLLYRGSVIWSVMVISKDGVSVDSQEPTEELAQSWVPTAGRDDLRGYQVRGSGMGGCQSGI